MIRTLLISSIILLTILLYKSDYFVYPIDEVEIVSTTSNHNNRKINDIVNSLQGSDLLSLDLNMLKNKLISDGWKKSL